MIISFHRVFLRYNPECEGVTPGEAGKFVQLDSASGGYPYATEITDAHDFQSIEKALKYAKHFDRYEQAFTIPVHVKVTYQIE